MSDDAEPLAHLSLRAECLDRRREAVRSSLRAQGLDGIICYGNGRHSFLASNPAWYLTGFRQLGPHMAVLLPVDGDPVVVTTPAWDLGRIKEQVDMFDIVAVEPEDFLATIRVEIERRNMRTKRLAVAGGVQPRMVSDAWSAMLDQPPVPGDKLVSDIARVRDAWSLACVRKAVDIAERGYQYGLEIARPGMPEYKLAAEMEAFMRGLGAEDNFQLLAASQHNRAAHRPSERLLNVGDVLLGEITPAVEGEYVQICRSAVVGTPTNLQCETFALLDRALRDAMRAAKPGVAARDIVTIMNAPIVAAGYETYTKPPYMRTRGHSMALGSMDPEIALNSDEIMVKGMVFVMHPNQYIPETGYMMCGEPVLITDEGAQPLTSRMGQLDVIAV
ncbi:M24 family metallopeptidase [Microvirga alba]|uniref:Aminopeptidase P family protein n=1 Tax=Microvirga alba TaxID=2791025 RepID=A0A931FR21_9HYPH|nr:Xaa-Pro peptidase family protein [Microvirga alba]MBF9235282.1 aminopeptidase P family protein [Microvirga alba]